MQQGSQFPLSLSNQQAQSIVQLMGQRGPVQVTEVTRHNHVWRLQCGQECFYLKTYTKDWYGNDVPRTEYCVRHERDAYTLLARHGLSTIEVALAHPDCDNPLGRPFLLTSEVAGVSLNQLLAQMDAKHFQALLECAGDYLRRVHEITFAYPGYILGDGPLAAPASNEWQHSVWSAQVCQRNALAMLERDRKRLSLEVANELQALFGSLAERLAPAYQPLRFVQANMHSHQFFLEPQDDDWRVTGMLDMEVASAGDSMFDLVAFALEMAAFHPVSTRWWEPFFHGYNAMPDFELFRLHMLTFSEESFKCFGPDRWPGTRQEILARLLTAKTWEALFVT
jgi:aminoglycoside phosphotransferase